MATARVELGGRKRVGGGHHWSILNKLVMLLILLVAVIMALMAFIPEIQRHRDAQSEIRSLQNEVRNQQAILRRQLREQELLQSNPEYIEMIARDMMDLMKEDETVFRLDMTRSGAVPGTPATVEPFQP